MSSVTFTDVFKIIFAVILPPLGVFMEVGLSGAFWLNVLLTLLGFVPGVVHALYVILTR
ncbi:YqaE/Pmp3 family membrane protein [Methylomagnum sp.]